MDKEYYSIGEVAGKTKIPAHTLRYWEKEGLVKSVRSGNSQRKYKKSDIELVEHIKNLLHLKKLTIEGAKRELSRRKPASGMLHLNLGQDETGKTNARLSAEIKDAIQDTISIINRVLERSEDNRSTL